MMAGVNVFLARSYPIYFLWALIAVQWENTKLKTVRAFSSEREKKRRKKKQSITTEKCVLFLFSSAPPVPRNSSLFRFVWMFYVCFVDSTARWYCLDSEQTNARCYRAIFAVAPNMSSYIRAAKENFGEIDRLLCYDVRTIVLRFDVWKEKKSSELIRKSVANFSIGFYFSLFSWFFQIRAVSLARTKVLEINELRVRRVMVNQRVCVPYWMKNNCKP